MTDKRLNIVIIEPSEILSAGILALLNRLGFSFNTYEYENIENIVISALEKIDILIINPGKVQNKDHDFKIIKNKFPDSIYITFLHSVAEKEIVNNFDHAFSIYEHASYIKATINSLLEIKRKNVNRVNEKLSAREIEVLKHIVAGLSNKEIAEKLYISIHTVISHRKKISQKTGIKSQAGLTIYAISNKIINVEDY